MVDSRTLFLCLNSPVANTKTWLLREDEWSAKIGIWEVYAETPLIKLLYMLEKEEIVDKYEN